MIVMNPWQTAGAMTPEEAVSAYENGDYAEAVATLRSMADKAPRKEIAQTRAGVALMRTGDIASARRYLVKGTHECKIYLAELDFMDYNLDSAEEWLEKYDQAKKKARRAADKKAFERTDPDAERVRDRISRARSMMDRVEKIVVIDSISVDKENFFKYYRLARSAGRIEDATALPAGASIADPAVVYSSEDGSQLIWSAPDEDENYVLVQSGLLADGSWETPHALGKILNDGGDANYPFLMPDGVTLYFANDGENTLGGYDIFISRFDGEKFLQPQNIGMPYNSPYNDYMLAIDDETGIGWWATDRNALQDSVTIYRFVPQELRINYAVDTPGLPVFALLSDYKATWEPGADYTALNSKVDNLRPEIKHRHAAFYFALPDGSVRTSIDSFHSAPARALMKEYMDKQKSIEESEKYLTGLREKYRVGDASVEADIMAIEAELPRMRASLAELRDAIVTAEN